MYQGSMVEVTVVLKLNQGVPGNGGNHFPAAFCVTFFRKKVTEKKEKVPFPVNFPTGSPQYGYRVYGRDPGG